MKKNSAFFERILQIVEYKGFNSINDFALRGLGYKASEKINRLKDENNSPSIDIIIDITNQFEEINPKWLISGKEDMIRIDIENSVVVAEQAQSRIRYWPDIEATGGGVMSFDDSIKEGYVEMVLPNFKDCTDAISIKGDSMYPRYKSGQIVILKPWNESYIEYGQAYLIVTTTGHRMIKYLYPSKDKENLQCVSENKEQYPPFDVEKESISNLYVVKGVIDQNTL